MKKEDDKTILAASNGERDVVLLILLLAFFLISILLDSTFTIPKSELLRSIMAIGYWSSAFLIMFLIAHQLYPSVFDDVECYIRRYKRKALVGVVSAAAVMLAINIKTGGDINSPYVSFLSSFPIFCMVLIFDSVTLRNCLKGAGIVVVSLIVVYVSDFVLRSMFGHAGIAVDRARLDCFLKSTDFFKLTLSVLIITAVSNLISIYLGARK